jgi:hypothetical protein
MICLAPSLTSFWRNAKPLTSKLQTVVGSPSRTI